MIAAGVGNEVKLQLGGKTAMPSIGLKGEPLQVRGRVRAITDGEFVITGPMYTGIRTFLGRTAVLDTGSRADRGHRTRARTDGPGRVHPLRHRSAAKALHHAQVAYTLPRRVQADRRAHRRVCRRRRHQRRPVRVSLRKTHAGRSGRSTRSDPPGRRNDDQPACPPTTCSIDIGNTFLKWGLFRSGSSGQRAREPARIAATCCSRKCRRSPRNSPRFPTPAQIVISNVAGTRVRSTMIRVLEVWPDAPRRTG